MSPVGRCRFIYELGRDGKFFATGPVVDRDKMKTLLLFLIRAYQLTLSPFVGQHCRFTPSCSRYAAEAIERYGAWKGGWLAVRRIARCHPFCDGGHDPVP